jgi:hypothetical protein
LKLRRASGDIYIDTQIFAGFMFLGAALCTWLLRSWKIDQLEREAAKRQQKEDGRPVTRSVGNLLGRLSLGLKGLIVWRRV